MLSKLNRFHGSAVFRWVYKGGQQVRGRYLAVRFRAQDNMPAHYAVVVSRKVSKSAVVRNHIRRRVYEIVRTMEPIGPTGPAVVITVYDEVLDTMPAAAVRKEVATMLLKARNLSQQTASRAIVDGKGE